MEFSHERCSSRKSLRDFMDSDRSLMHLFISSFGKTSGLLSFLLGL